ncbi:MAG: AAA family ATPase [Verrucomicrobia bacterium]|nr:AAA family ATPase [Verrucomicrobiota bacterium]
MPADKNLRQVLAQPSGARFYRCALQVNPCAYLKRHSKPLPCADEAEYNRLVVEACKASDVEVIGVTDHYRIRESVSLIQAAEAAGLAVLPGFEAETKDGVHFLCLFEPGTEPDQIEAKIHDCGVHSDNEPSPSGKYDCEELLAEAARWGVMCIAAHVTTEKGLLRVLKGQTRARVWRHGSLIACSIPGHTEDTPQEFRDILVNKDVNHRRNRMLAVINAQDISSPADVAKLGAITLIKMSKVGVEGLRQGFIDPATRVRLIGHPEATPHSALLYIGWQGGFLDGSELRLNGNVNVLIGGRGAGKSTLVESVRYALGLSPLGPDAQKNHTGIVQQALRSATRIRLLLRSHRPAEKHYWIERTIPNPPVVKDETGNVLNVRPQDILPGIEIYGQHEIAELARSPEKLTGLLRRFREGDPALENRKSEIRRRLETSRIRILEIRKEIGLVDEKLAGLPALQETLKRFQEAGLESKLKSQTLLVREEKIVATLRDRLLPFQELMAQWRDSLPIDRQFLSTAALDGLPGAAILQRGDAVLEKFNTEAEAALKAMARAIEEAQAGIGRIEHEWQKRKEASTAEIEHILREVQKTVSRLDASEFVRLRKQIEDLQPLSGRRHTLVNGLEAAFQERNSLLLEWEEAKAEFARSLERAAKKVTKKLAGVVRVNVAPGGQRDPLFALLRDEVGGQLQATIERLSGRVDFSLPEFVSACRGGTARLVESFGLTQTQSDRIAKATEETFLKMEELEFPTPTGLQLNLAGEGQPPIWQDLENLSTGQKATAVLLLLLLESEAPLIVDQPEDDLDNRFITEGIVPKIREEKERRQFIFATHNANIPVLGDAELVATLKPDGAGHAAIPPEELGSIDCAAVRDNIGEVLEGGREAFEIRRLKYGY